MGFLDGLAAFGLKNIQPPEDIYSDEKPEKKKQEEKKAAKPTPMDEVDFLIDKEYECQVCQQKFKQRIVRSGKAKMISQDLDLRPVYNGIDMQKYDVIVCPHCGYSVLTRYYGPMAPTHRKLIREKITANFKPQDSKVPNKISYEEAFPRYQLALVNAVMRQAKSSERAFICLKTAWLLRGWQAEILDDAAKREEMKKEERDYLEKALEGFLKARASEQPPYAGMNELALDILMSALCVETKTHQQDASRMLQGILYSKTATNSQKDRARDMLEMLKENE